ncbi:MAG: hypothetical protein IJO57_04175 [Bacilli bacterium]|nr:hypothetical protein [Bacilli bacterium]
MYRKRILFLLILLLGLTGCTKLSNDYNVVVDTILKEKQKTNTVSTNYELYIPTGIKQIEDNEYNQKLQFKKRDIYLYVDTISYYYKNKLNLKDGNTYDFFYKEINYNGKEGYIGIRKIEEDYYFCKIVYNYAKIEFHSDSEYLPLMVANSLTMVNSIKYNDNLIKVSLGKENTAGKEITYEFITPDNTDGSFSDYLEEYKYEEEVENEELPDEE